jgi:hypothetical protein
MFFSWLVSHATCLACGTHFAKDYNRLFRGCHLVPAVFDFHVFLTSIEEYFAGLQVYVYAGRSTLGLSPVCRMPAL